MTEQYTEEDLREILGQFRQTQNETPREEPTLPPIEDNSGYDPKESPTSSPPPKFDGKDFGLAFEDCIELYSFFSSDIQQGLVTLHPWQVEIGEELSYVLPDSQHPFRFCLCAANGSGKDAFVIAPFAVWFILTKKQSRVLITSSSGVQLTNQTEKYISDLANTINNWSIEHFGSKVFHVVQRKIECLLTGSIINMFATDEEGKAEGYHPIVPNGEFAIIVNEAKSVTPDIFRALRRCTGFNYWILVSTPGAPAGDFYYAFCNWPRVRRVTFFDCPHLSREMFDADREELGEHSPLFRSKWLALFTTLDENFVIKSEALEKLQRRIRDKTIQHRHKLWPLRVGIDLAAGGDENVVSIWHGNKQIALKCFRQVDTLIGAERIDQILREAKIPLNHAFIFADDGGVGRAMIDMLRHKGWTINRVNNNWTARNKKDYRNRGAEQWAKFARFVEECLIIPLDDKKQWEQLKTRRFKDRTTSDKLCLERKAEARADGHASPDRADATVLAFTDVTYSDLDRDDDVDEAKLRKRYTAADIDDLFSFRDEFTKKVLGKHRINGSLDVALRRSSPHKNLIHDYHSRHSTSR